MRQGTSRRVRRATVLAVLAVVVAGAGCTPGGGGRSPSPDAQAAWFRTGDGQVTARYAGEHGWVPAGGLDATLFGVDVEGSSADAVCVERYQWLEPDQAHAARAPEEAGIDHGGRAAWVAAHHGEVGTPLAPDQEQAAVQLAAWIVVGDATPDEIADVALAARVDELLAASEGQVAPSGPTRVQLAAEVVDDQGTVEVRLLADGEPMPGERVAVAGPGLDEVVRTGADGTARARVTGPGDVTARWDGQLAPGVVLEPADAGGQALMTIEPVDLVRTDEVVVDAVEARRAA